MNNEFTENYPSKNQTSEYCMTQNDTPNGGTEFVPETKTASHHPNTGHTESVELPDDAVGITVDYEAGAFSGGNYIIRYLVPDSER